MLVEGEKRKRTEVKQKVGCPSLKWCDRGGGGDGRAPQLVCSSNS